MNQFNCKKKKEERVRYGGMMNKRMGWFRCHEHD